MHTITCNISDSDGRPARLFICSCLYKKPKKWYYNLRKKKFENLKNSSFKKEKFRHEKYLTKPYYIQDILRLVTVIVEEDQINTPICSPGALIRQYSHNHFRSCGNFLVKFKKSILVIVSFHSCSNFSVKFIRSYWISQVNNPPFRQNACSFYLFWNSEIFVEQIGWFDWLDWKFRFRFRHCITCSLRKNSRRTNKCHQFL